jgi:hypothetical protein
MTTDQREMSALNAKVTILNESITGNLMFQLNRTSKSTKALIDNISRISILVEELKHELSVVIDDYEVRIIAHPEIKVPAMLRLWNLTQSQMNVSMKITEIRRVFPTVRVESLLRNLWVFCTNVPIHDSLSCVRKEFSELGVHEVVKYLHRSLPNLPLCDILGSVHIGYPELNESDL